MPSNNSLIYYLRAGRYRKTINTLTLVFFGSLIAAGFSISMQLVLTILLIYTFFGLFLYGGLYALNEVYDIKYDKGIKNNIFFTNNNVIAYAKVFSIVSIIIGWILTYLFIPKLLVFYYLFLGINVLYTLVFKRLSMFFATMLASMTGPLKLFLGMFITGSIMPSFILLCLIHYFSSVQYHAVKNYSRHKLHISQLYILITTSILLSTILVFISIRLGSYISLIFYFVSIINVLYYYHSKKVLDYY